MKRISRSITSRRSISDLRLAARVVDRLAGLKFDIAEIASKD